MYLKTKKLDILTGDPYIILVNTKDAQEVGLNPGQKLLVRWQQSQLYGITNITSTQVDQGEIGLYTDIWEGYGIPANEMVEIEMIERPASIEYIKKKIQGYKLTKEEINEIISDVSQRKIREVEIAYFMSCFFNPGFDDEEVVNIAKAMANNGEILDFKDIRNNGSMIVDKHSIGGIAGKGVTPILVPIIACADLVIPNTSTRAITTPGGTTDILECVMPVSQTIDEIYNVVRKCSGCLIWGGSVRLAPADDNMINVEKELHMQSNNKFIASIIAKKIAMGISHILIDIPYGHGAKIEDADAAEMLSKKFVKQFANVGITCETYKRFVNGPDGRGIGPVLEMADILKVLEQKEDRPRALENTAIAMAGQLLEMSSKVGAGRGKSYALKRLESGEALKKFWEIAQAQGAKKIVKSEELKAGEYTHDIFAGSKVNGKIRVVNNKEVVKICKALGAPQVKGAGMYLHKTIGDVLHYKDKICTLYATSAERLKVGIEAVNLDDLYSTK